MPAVTRKGDLCTGHGDFSARASIGGSGNVFVEGAAAHRQGDGWASHCNSKPVCHGGSLATGSGAVFVNGQPLGRVGDAVDCGSAVASGAATVFAGG